MLSIEKGFENGFCSSVWLPRNVSKKFGRASTNRPDRGALTLARAPV
jgi:hypothetical protein